MFALHQVLYFRKAYIPYTLHIALCSVSFDLGILLNGLLLIFDPSSYFFMLFLYLFIYLFFFLLFFLLLSYLHFFCIIALHNHRQIRTTQSMKFTSLSFYNGNTVKYHSVYLEVVEHLFESHLVIEFIKINDQHHVLTIICSNSLKNRCSRAEAQSSAKIQA